MTQTFWTLPEICAKPAKKQERKGVFRKYDHWQMLQDRLSGLSWADIAKKHGIKSGHDAQGLAFRSRATKRLHPEEVERLESIGRVRSKQST